MANKKADQVAVPENALAGYRFEPQHYADAYRVGLHGGWPMDMRSLASHLFARRASFPGYVMLLLNVRDVLVKPLGIQRQSDLQERTQSGEWIGLFEVFHCSSNEIIMGDNDRHLDFRVSLLRSTGDEGLALTLSTVVQFHNLLGRIYFAVIKPFHKMIVAAMMKKAFLTPIS